LTARGSRYYITGGVGAKRVVAREGKARTGQGS
jgi:hypothetical protein